MAGRYFCLRCRFVPLQFRVLFINVVALCWSIFLLLRARKLAAASQQQQQQQAKGGAGQAADAAAQQEAAWAQKDE